MPNCNSQIPGSQTSGATTGWEVVSECLSQFALSVSGGLHELLFRHFKHIAGAGNCSPWERQRGGPLWESFLSDLGVYLKPSTLPWVCRWGRHQKCNLKETPKLGQGNRWKLQDTMLTLFRYLDTETASPQQSLHRLRLTLIAL